MNRRSRRIFSPLFVAAAPFGPACFEAHPAACRGAAAGVVAGMVFGVAAWRLRFLTAGGAWAGGLFAASLLGLGGWAWAGPALCFFVLSSLLSKLGARKKRAAAALGDKGHRRDAGQVCANGGVAWVMLVAHAVDPAELWFWGFAGALAAATADTWATELGTLSPETPRLLTTGRRVAPGTSGGVSLVGTVGAVAGAAVIAGSIALFAPARFSGAALALVTAAGVFAAAVDSLAGATVQAQYRERQTGRLTERARSAEGAHPLVRGRRFMDNDRVNLLGSAVGALLAMLGQLMVAG